MKLIGLVALAMVSTVSSAMAQTPSLGAAPPQTDWGTFKFDATTGTTNGIVAGQIDSVLKVLPSILKDLGIETKGLDLAATKLTIPRQKAYRTLGKDRVSKSLGCGDGLTGPNADNYYVYLRLQIALSPLPDSRTSLAMAFGGEAVDIPGSQTERVACASTGDFERRLAKRLQLKFLLP